MRKLLVTLQDIQGRRGGRGEERAGWGIRWGRADLASLAASHCYRRTREFRNPSSVFSQDFTDKGIFFLDAIASPSTRAVESESLKV